MVQKIRKILYASDLSENSMPALNWAMSLAHQHDAQLFFLHVLEEVSPHAASAIRSFMGEEQWEALILKQQSDANEEIMDRINRFCERAKPELNDCPFVVKETIIQQGEPSQVIVEKSETDDYDIIVMGTHGGGLFKDAMIGSTARRVLRRSKTPVFVIPLSAA